MSSDQSPSVATLPATDLPTAARLGLVAAAPLWLAGWAVMRLGGHRGANAGWALAHSLWIVAFVLFGLAFVGLHRLAAAADRRRGAAAALGVALVGTAATLGQMGCDLAVGLLSADHAEMSRRYDDVFAVPGVHLVLFTLGPVLLFTGLVALAWLAFRRGVLPARGLALTVLGVAMMVIGKPLPGPLRLLEGLGAVGIALALAPLVDEPGPAPGPA